MNYLETAVYHNKFCDGPNGNQIIDEPGLLRYSFSKRECSGHSDPPTAGDLAHLTHVRLSCYDSYSAGLEL